MVLATIATCLVWALFHLGNTDSPLVKITQIFLIGLALTEMARRMGLEAALAAHISLNLCSVVFGFWLE